MTFLFTSGPAYVMTWIGITGYAIISHADFSAYATWSVTLLVAYIGKRLLKFKIGQTEITTNGGSNGSDTGKDTPAK